MRIVHMADTHLGYRQYNLSVREQDFYDVFNQAIDIALEERADVIIHSGDLFDAPTPPIKALYTLKEALRKIEGKIEFITVLGEHDVPKRRGMIPQRLFKLHTLGDNYDLDHVEVGGVLFAGISNVRGKYSEHLKEELKKFDALAKGYDKSVLILHQAFKKFLPFEGAYQLALDDLPRTANYYALGHIHARQHEKFGKGVLAYAGSTEITGKDEINTWKDRGKGIYLVDLDDEVHLEAINLDIRPQLNLKVNVHEIDKISEELQYEKKPIVHVEVYGDLINKSAAYEKLQKLLTDKVEDFRPTFRDTTVKEVHIPKGPLNMRAVLEDYFKEGLKADLALKLYESLSINEINDAKEIAQDFLNEEVADRDN